MYDSNHVLKLHKIKELTPLQQSYFDEWWRLYYNSYLNGTDDLIINMLVRKPTFHALRKMYNKLAISG